MWALPGHLVGRAAAGAPGSPEPAALCGATIPPGNPRVGFGCTVTNRFHRLFDDESGPFEVLKATENKKKQAGGGDCAGGPGAKTAAQAAAQTNSNAAGRQRRKESQKER